MLVGVDILGAKHLHELIAFAKTKANARALRLHPEVWEEKPDWDIIRHVVNAAHHSGLQVVLTAGYMPGALRGLPHWQHRWIDEYLIPLAKLCQESDIIEIWNEPPGFGFTAGPYDYPDFYMACRRKIQHEGLQCKVIPAAPVNLLQDRGAHFRLLMHWVTRWPKGTPVNMHFYGPSFVKAAWYSLRIRFRIGWTTDVYVTEFGDGRHDRQVLTLALTGRVIRWLLRPRILIWHKLASPESESSGHALMIYDDTMEKVRWRPVVAYLSRFAKRSK